ncbi:glycoside hydrolase family 48 protein [Pseudobacteroides cellulosolvens]|uniref:Cellulose 1,4-beta-cellobiosidase n=1 Tax=Pseudobacteroides cellulosolvens ATCC 35603 = DSM 2933 TaxID=398512 RepID=Q6UB36_9FIRM|nr:glycoside hydrolase family 48 protein [Pseudobacteroides cellulosolvens]AAR23324.1 cellulosomal family-48 processive glycoside hydrolase precursor [Pseudobacteroides cellulosolvens ATCC 35603 = DSM 2933]KNY25635.1 Cellulose 1,4-beta-cellobiosidase [Pseudobacteroides cellulosolvens ATCC 35603 = DSM 2933]
MFKKTRKYVSIALCTFMTVSTLAAPILGSNSYATSFSSGMTYEDAFIDLHEKLNDPANGYFSQEGVPYHSIETMMVEAPDYGHETASETASYYVWFEAMYGKLTGDWSGYNKAWDITEKYYIPSDKDQPNLGDYDQSKCASFVPGGAEPSDYPGQLNLNAPTGKDNLHAALKSAYGKDSMYLMHWILDVDNWYKYGNHGDGTSRVSQINTYQRGEQESCWETVPFPCWETYKWGNTSKGGFGSLFVAQDSYAQQWRYSVAGDADARSVQAAYWAVKWAKEQGKLSSISKQNDRAAKMGDYLRYIMYDKYMKPIAKDTSVTSTAGDGKNSMHYLISWYCAWGAPTTSQGWAWKEGSSASHQGYQNPMTAYALSTISELKPKASGAVSDWAKSLDRQLEMIQWLQSSEGPIAGGCNNSWNDKYDPYPDGISTFYDMAYDWQPVWHDPPSNRWYGFQVWGLQRTAEYYYETGDERAYQIMKKWVDWVKPYIKVNGPGDFEIPSDLEWDGQPDTWDGTYTGNPDLHCEVTSMGSDIGVAGSTANLLAYYAAGTQKHHTFDEEAYDLGKQLLDCIILGCADEKGYTKEEQRGDYSRFFDQEVYIPSGWTGKNAQGATLKSGMKFIDMRPAYKQDPNWDNLQTAYDAGVGPKFKYHRFWHQVELGMAMGAFAILFPNDVPPPPITPTPFVKLKGDLNGDGVINMADVMILAQSFGKAIGNPGVNEKADLNNDGVINMADAIILAQYFGKTKSAEVVMF